MTRIDRIQQNERRLDAIEAAASALAEALDSYEAAQEAVRELEAYYTSDEWTSDLDADRAGELPSDLKRGVLSEDAAYDALTENRELAVRMLDIVSKML